MLQVLLFSFIAVALTNTLYFFYYARFSFAKNEAKTSLSQKEALPISVIVCAKNEADNLRRHIPFLLQQEYQDFELILINDCSTDRTLQVMEQFQEKDQRIKIVNVQNNERFWANKKYALTLGIKRAKNEYLLFTDADCKPTSKRWIQEMATNFSNQKSIILGYGGYQKEQGFLNKLIRFETLLTALQYFGYAKNSNAYMGVGRNLAYTSSVYYQNKGFVNHIHIRSGDDDLFVNAAATPKNTAICVNKEAFTRSIPKKSFKAWLRQKRRHVSTAKHYKTKHKRALSVFYVTQLLFWLLFVAGILSGYNWQIFLGFFALRMFMAYAVYFKTAVTLDEKDLRWAMPAYELSLVCLQFTIFIVNLFQKPKHWE